MEEQKRQITNNTGDEKSHVVWITTKFAFQNVTVFDNISVESYKRHFLNTGFIKLIKRFSIAHEIPEGGLFIFGGYIRRTVESCRKINIVQQTMDSNMSEQVSSNTKKELLQERLPRIPEDCFVPVCDIDIFFKSPNLRTKFISTMKYVYKVEERVYSHGYTGFEVIRLRLYPLHMAFCRGSSHILVDMVCPREASIQLPDFTVNQLVAHPETGELMTFHTVSSISPPGVDLCDLFGTKNHKLTYGMFHVRKKDSELAAVCSITKDISRRQTRMLLFSREYFRSHLIDYCLNRRTVSEKDVDASVDVDVEGVVKKEYVKYIHHFKSRFLKMVKDDWMITNMPSIISDTLGVRLKCDHTVLLLDLSFMATDTPYQLSHTCDCCKVTSVYFDDFCM